ncbi:MAG TPA: dynamin family protein, partial [Saprospiraceae bacterium]|nr:dynamin family protein [Saprospiraceae bacterium]
MSQLISRDVQIYRAQVEEIIKDLHELVIQTGNEDLGRTVSDLRNRINDPFMFVIVGEVKAGKSSFINALLSTGKEIAKVAPQPMTDTIQQIVFGEQEEAVTVNPFLKKIFLPVDILREIAIVDTPGTNTIVEHHQEITESFIPASDLIVFVFEAKNPYRQSAWEFFEYIHQDWQKKVIFVLQQKDLMEPADLEVNFNGVAQQAEKKGITAPNVFAVSAKQEQDGRIEESGFGPLRTYIRAHITGGKAPLLKLQNSAAVARNILERIRAGVQLRSNQWEADVAFRTDIHDTLEQQQTKSYKHVDVLVENLLAGFDRITRQKRDELSEGLSFFALLKRSLAGLFSKKTSPQEWLGAFAQSLEQDLNTEMQRKLNEGVADLSDSIQQMAKIIDLKIRNSQTILRNDHELFSSIAERRANVLRDLQDTFSTFLAKTENFAQRDIFPDRSSISPNIATGSGLAVVGIILAAVT